MKTIKPYFFNCFLLSIPVLVWDMLFTGRLPSAYQPAIFWKEIPSLLAFGENATRIILFLMMAVMPICIQTRKQKTGLLLYITGLVVYFAAWLILMYAPSSTWSRSILGFMSPAYTPVLWLAGIGVIGNSFYFNATKFKMIYYTIAAAFLILHNYHTYLVFTG